MKKILSVVFIAVLMISCLATAAFAAEAPQVVVSNAAVDNGIATVEVSLKNNTGFNAYNIKLVYGKELTLQEVKAGELVNNKGLLNAAASVGFIAMSEITDDGVLFTASFAVAEGAKCGKYPVTVEIINLGANNVEMGAGVVAGSVERDHVSGSAKVENKVPADCGSNGSYDEVVYCSVCNEELSREHKTELATGNHTHGTPVKENVVSAGCGSNGTYDEVVYCTVCNKEVTRTHKTELATGNHTHGTPVKENVVPADCGNNGGYDEVVYCTVCNKEVTRTHKTELATGKHTYENGVCTVCKAKDPNYKDESSDTGYEIHLLLPVALMIVSGLGLVACVYKRKRAN